MRSLAVAEEAMARELDCLLVGSVGNVNWLHVIDPFTTKDESIR